ncbi:hypothetical protein BDV98DRAFT_133183 [Pterulicium gracile]|uniref:Uncharacterized protein n=1 Tax=Pterulicium gracile TaxID=1884261 RepID=A0A5C3QC90_9AGAR|nr:hypothetical protein BDV98DRAFT_133183 [Pterula gracilis]
MRHGNISRWHACPSKLSVLRSLRHVLQDERRIARALPCRKLNNRGRPKVPKVQQLWLRHYRAPRLNTATVVTVTGCSPVLLRCACASSTLSFIIAGITSGLLPLGRGSLIFGRARSSLAGRKKLARVEEMARRGQSNGVTLSRRYHLSTRTPLTRPFSLNKRRRGNGPLIGGGTKESDILQRSLLPHHHRESDVYPLTRRASSLLPPLCPHDGLPGSRERTQRRPSSARVRFALTTQRW